MTVVEANPAKEDLDSDSDLIVWMTVAAEDRGNIKQ